jgi:hypothetical protein
MPKFFNCTIINHHDLLKKSHEKSEFYRQHAVQADLVTPRRRCRLVFSDADNVLTPDELHHQLVWARDDIQVRDRALERLKVQHTQLQASFEQVLTSSSELHALHVELLEQHIHLIFFECDVPAAERFTPSQAKLILRALAELHDASCCQAPSSILCKYRHYPWPDNEGNTYDPHGSGEGYYV